MAGTLLNVSGNIPCLLFLAIFFNMLRPEQSGWYVADNFKCIFEKRFKFWIQFHWYMFLRAQLRISHHWFRYVHWLGECLAPSYNLNQWFSPAVAYGVTRPQWVDPFYTPVWKTNVLCRGNVRLSVRPHFPDFSSTCFEISIWNLVYTFSRWHDMSSLSCITIGSLWPSLQPKVGQTHFLQSWPHKSR